MAITGADGHVGTTLQRRLARLANQVRPLRRADGWAAGFEGSGAVIHLAGTLQPKPPDTYQTANVDTVRRLIEALGRAPVERIVFLSYLGADSSSDNAYLRAKGEAEKLIGDIGLPAVILRSTFIYGDLHDIGPSFAGYQARPGKTVSVIGDGTQRMAPLHVSDLTELLVAAALDPDTPTGTFEVGGPDVVALDDLVRAINPSQVRIRHLSAPVARLFARLLPQLTPALVDVLLADSVPAADPTKASSRFGVVLRHLPDSKPVKTGTR